MRPLVIGLTGPIGSGKSHVRNVLVSLGAEGIDADLLAHQVMAPGGAAFEPVVDAFGSHLLDAEGAIDRRKLAAIVFSDAGALARLEAIVHPAVSQAVMARIAASMRCVSAALTFDVPFRKAETVAMETLAACATSIIVTRSLATRLPTRSRSRTSR